MDPIVRPGRGGRYVLDATGGVQPAGTPPAATPAPPAAAPATQAEAVPPSPSPRKTSGKAGATKE